MYNTAQAMKCLSLSHVYRFSGTSITLVQLVFDVTPHLELKEVSTNSYEEALASYWFLFLRKYSLLVARDSYSVTE